MDPVSLKHKRDVEGEFRVLKQQCQAKAEQGVTRSDGVLWGAKDWADHRPLSANADVKYCESDSCLRSGRCLGQELRQYFVVRRVAREHSTVFGYKLVCLFT